MPNFTPLDIAAVLAPRKKNKTRRIPVFMGIGISVILLVIAAIVINTVQPNILGEYTASQKGADPVVYWKFDGARSTEVQDSTTNDNDGVLSSASWEYDNQCISYNCLSYNGTSAYVSRTYSSDTELDPGTGNFTISMWFKHYNAISGTDILVSRYNNAGYKIYMNSSGNMCFDIDSDSTWGGAQYDTACTSLTYNDSRWHHLIAVRTASSIDLYINDTLVAQDTSLAATGSLSGSSPTLYLGVDSNGSSNYWAGYTDEFRFYNYGRDLTQRKLDFIGIGGANAQPAAAGSYARKFLSDGLVGRWRLDETAANSCSGGTNDSCDTSGNAQDGAWNGSTVQTSNGRFDYGVTLDGTGDYVSVANSTTVSPTNALTISAWVYPTSVNSRAIIVKNNSFRLVTDASGFPICQFYKDGAWQTGATSNLALTANIWSQVICTFDGVQIVTFVNSVRTADANLVAPIDSSANALEFGRDAGGTYTDFAGRLDEIRLYNKALTEREARDMYQWAPGPVAYWKMDENAGTSFYDASGNDFTGTFAASTNDPEFIPGRYASGIDFDGNDYATVSHNAKLTLNAWTISAWVNADSFTDNGYNTVIWKGTDTSTNYYIQLGDTNGGAGSFTEYFYCGFHNGSSWVEYSANVALSTNQWYFVTCTFDTDSDQMQIFVNGRRYRNQTGITSNPNNNTSAITFGNDPNYGEYLDGTVDHVSIYNYVRTQEQIYEDMWGGYRPSSSTRIPIGYWRFEEYRSTTANNSGTEISDYNGTLSNMATNPSTTTSGWTYFGKIGRALIFDGSNDYVNVGSDGIIDNMDTFTLSAWINPQGWGESSLGNIVSKGSNFKFRLYNSGGEQTLQFFRDRATTDTTAYAANNDIALNTWTHVTVVYDQNNYVKLYVNGKEAIYSSRTLGSGSLTSDSGSSMHFGGVNGAESFQGIIDEVKVYNIALNDDEVVQDYRQGAAVQVGNKGEVDISPNPTLTPQAQIGDSSEYYNYCVPGDTTACGQPQHEWKLDKISGSTTLRDSGSGIKSANIRDCSWGATARYGSARVGTGANFRNNTADYITCSNIATFTTGSLSFWIMPYTTFNSSSTTSTGFYNAYSSNTSNSNIVFRGTDYTGSGSAGAIVFQREVSGTNNYVASTTTTWNANEWYYITLNWGSGTWQLYVNGTLEGSASFTAGMFDLATDEFGRARFDTENIGAGPTRYFDGKMDQIIIYDYKRTPAQIKWEMDRGKPILWWRLDDCTGTTANASNNLLPRINGTITIGASGTQTATGTCDGGGTTAWNTGTNGKYVSSINLDGTDDYIQSTSSDTTVKNSQFSISMWVNPTGTDGYYASKYGTGCSQAQFQLYQESGSLYFTIPNSAGTCGAASTSYTALPTNEWSHIVGTFDGTNAKLYVDNRLRSTSSAFSGTFNTTSGGNFNISVQGERSVGRMPGRYDDIQLFNYPLTEAQVRVLYNDGAALRYAPITGVP